MITEKGKIKCGDNKTRNGIRKLTKSKEGKQNVPEEFTLVSSAIRVNSDICGIFESLPLFTLQSVVMHRNPKSSMPC